MFENVLYQNASVLIADDIAHGALPSSLLFAGPPASGKLTCALELARILACRSAEARGAWNCACPSCLKHKALMHSGLLLTGFRASTLEIAAARQTLVEAARVNAPYLASVRYLFLRSVRKLTARFSPVLWADDDKASKISPLVASVDEALEELDPSRPLPEPAALEKATAKLASLCEKLDAGFVSGSVPVAHIRHISSWARFTVAEGKKTVIIENADRMQEGARNALLKVLEEPPEDAVFVLLTEKRSAVLPTILSRVRTYQFGERTAQEQAEVLLRVFHASPAEGDDPSAQGERGIERYLRSFLPTDANAVSKLGNDFAAEAIRGSVPDVRAAVAAAKNFEPRLLLDSFFDGFYRCLRSIRVGLSAQENPYGFAFATEREHFFLHQMAECYSRITTYNQTPTAALEQLAQELATYGNG
ncbi:hypothetical protein [Treponema endosymbiont of Eucomonympha sp.]|uniref:hypothetical protein n=1 Tax=Treponema endosymbiont of Eucomonympha sp. TaxID=1580831 RepID=UPI0007823DC7|nr:hypothetical protein [Treponema endosymbiont of Eucomonympha sp.]